MKNPRKQIKWTLGKCLLLRQIIDETMKAQGFVNFRVISEQIGHSMQSCANKASNMGISYNTRTENVSEAAPRYKFDLRKLPNHNNGQQVNYEGVNG